MAECAYSHGVPESKTVTPAAAARNYYHPKALLLLSGCLLLLAAWACPALADIQGPRADEKEKKKRDTPGENIRRAVEIPTPRDAAVRVLRGQPTDIVLSATAALRQPVEFRLGDAPQAGTLDALRPSAESSAQAIVTYTAAPGAAESDSFTFRAKHKDSATSGSATVRITIIDPKPDLIVPKEIDFGEAIIGETAVRTLVLANRGTGRFAGRLELSPPWRLLQELPDVEVLPGAKVELRMAFTPARPGAEAFTLRYPSLPGVQTKLAGLAGSPVSVQPSLIQMEWKEAARSRQAEVTLLNRTASALEYTITTSPRLQFPDERGSLPPFESRKIPLTLPEADAGELNTLFSVQARGTRAEVPLTALAAPPLLRLRETENIQSEGQKHVLAAKDGASSAIVLENSGGTAGTLFVKLPDGWTSPAYEDGKDMAPGEVRRLVVQPPAGPRGKSEGILEARLADQTLALSLAAPAPPESTGSAAKPDALLASQSGRAPAGADDEGYGPIQHYTADEQQMLFMTDILGIFPLGIKFDRSLPEIPRAGQSKIKKDRVTFYWEHLGDELGYIVFREEYKAAPRGRRPTRYWMPWEGLKFKVKDKTASVTLDNLTPGRKYIIRFAAQAKNGRVGPVSVPVLFYTPSPKPFPWGWLATVLILGGGGWWWHRRRQAEYE